MLEQLKEQFEVIERNFAHSISIRIEVSRSEAFIGVCQHTPSKPQPCYLRMTKNEALALAKVLVKFTRMIERAETAETLALLREIKIQ